MKWVQDTSYNYPVYDTVGPDGESVAQIARMAYNIDPDQWDVFWRYEDRWKYIGAIEAGDDHKLAKLKAAYIIRKYVQEKIKYLTEML